MKIESLYGSEDSYYELDLECDMPLHNKPKKKYKNNKKQKTRHKYKSKDIDKRKLNKLQNQVWWAVFDKGNYKKRNYLSGEKKFAKKMTNRKIRKYNGEVADGGYYRKFYDYWWSIF